MIHAHLHDTDHGVGTAPHVAPPSVVVSRQVVSIKLMPTFMLQAITFIPDGLSPEGTLIF